MSKIIWFKALKLLTDSPLNCKKRNKGEREGRTKRKKRLEAKTIRRPEGALTVTIIVAMPHLLFFISEAGF